MREEMEDDCEKFCVFGESDEIDLDFEFDVAKYFDFTRVESMEEVEECQAWFHSTEGHAPSPLVVKLGRIMDEVSENETSSSLRGSSANSSNSKGKTEHSRISTLLKPTASYLAKQKQPIGISSTRIPGRPQKLRIPLRSPEENMASKRQKLEFNFVRKAGQLEHQLSYSHKLPKQVVSSPARPNATIPKEPVLATAQRVHRHRPANVVLPSNDSTPGSSSANTSLQEKSDPEYRFKGCSVSKKIFSCKSDVGASRKREANVPREVKLSNSKTLPRNPPTELFSKLSLNSENQPGSLSEEKQHLRKEGFKKYRTRSNMKENKELCNPLNLFHSTKEVERTWIVMRCGFIEVVRFRKVSTLRHCLIPHRVI